MRRIGRRERLAWLGAYVLPSLLLIAWLLLPPWPEGKSPFTNGSALGAVAVDAMRCAATSLVLVSILIRIRLAK
jgi:hypothetical protein